MKDGSRYKTVTYSLQRTAVRRDSRLRLCILLLNIRKKKIMIRPKKFLGRKFVEDLEIFQVGSLFFFRIFSKRIHSLSLESRLTAVLCREYVTVL